MSRTKLSIIIIACLAMLVAVPVFADYGVQTKTANCSANLSMPDSDCTPGAVLTTSTAVICKGGYTKTVRNVSTATKKKVFAEYGISYKLSGKYEVDHLISLELGGSNDISNLWPESYSIANGSRIKDKFENYLHAQVCSGKMSLEDAQMQISGDWLSYYSAKLAADAAAKNPPVKKSTNSICHEKGSKYYSKTTKFTPYNSLDDCLASGGRLPK